MRRQAECAFPLPVVFLDCFSILFPISQLLSPPAIFTYHLKMYLLSTYVEETVVHAHVTANGGYR